MTRRIDISYRTIIFIAVFLLSLWILFLIRDIILLVFVAFIVMSALYPIVNKLNSWQIPKTLSVLLTFFTVMGILVAVITLGFTPLISETSNLTTRLADALSALLQVSLLDQSIIRQEMSKISGQLLNITFDVLRDLIALVSILVITIYMLLDREKIENYATSFFGVRQEKVQKILRLVEEKLGAWLRGQVVLSLLIGAMTYAGLLILGVEFALPLAILAGLLEVVPVIGPIIAAIPAVLLALTVSPFQAGLVTGLYVAIQQLEGHVVVPQVMRRAVGLNPLLVILAISVGGRLLGIGGALLAVPIAVVIQLVLQETLKVEE